MGVLDEKFMLDLEKARDLNQKIDARLDALAEVPEDLDQPYDQEGVDGLEKFSDGFYKLALELIEVAKGMRVARKIQEILDLETEKLKEQQNAEEDEGVRDMMDETGHSDGDF